MAVPPSLRRAGRIFGWSLIGLVLVLFLALAGGMAFLRTQPGERWITDTAVSALKSAGIEARIGSRPPIPRLRRPILWSCCGPPFWSRWPLTSPGI